MRAPLSYSLMGFFSPGRTPSTMKPVPSSRAVGSTSGVGLQVSGCRACPPGPWASATHCVALDSTALYPSLVHITIISRPCSTLHHSTIMYPILCCPLPTLPFLLYSTLFHSTLYYSIIYPAVLWLPYPVLLYCTLFSSTLCLPLFYSNLLLLWIIVPYSTVLYLDLLYSPSLLYSTQLYSHSLQTAVVETTVPGLQCIRGSGAHSERDRETTHCPSQGQQ